MNAPPKQGSEYRVLAIVLVVIGVIALVALGTCGVGAFLVKRKVDKVAAEIADGGLVLVSPPGVKADLAGPKKDYVGSWKSARGSTLDIDADGNLVLEKNEGGGHEKLQVPIAAFAGDDIEVRALVTIRIAVASPPRKVGAKWQMVADGITFER